MPKNDRNKIIDNYKKSVKSSKKQKCSMSYEPLDKNRVHCRGSPIPHREAIDIYN